jgi:hypothetical protein
MIGGKQVQGAATEDRETYLGEREDPRNHLTRGRDACYFHSGSSVEYKEEVDFRSRDATGVFFGRSAMGTDYTAFGNNDVDLGQIGAGGEDDWFAETEEELRRKLTDLDMCRGVSEETLGMVFTI